MKSIEQIVKEQAQAEIDRYYRCACCGKGITQAQYYFGTCCGYCDTGRCAKDKAENHMYFPKRIRLCMGKCAICGHDAQLILEPDNPDEISIGALMTRKAKYLNGIAGKRYFQHYITHYEKDRAICDFLHCKCDKPQFAQKEYLLYGRKQDMIPSDTYKYP